MQEQLITPAKTVSVPDFSAEGQASAPTAHPRSDMNCDRLARWYAPIERTVFGRALDHARTAMLAAVPDARSALVLGDGDGRFLEALLHANPDVRAHYLDLSEGMLQQAQARVARRAGTNRVSYHQGDALTEPLGERYDLVTSHFLLDCFDAHGIELLARRIRASSPPDASIPKPTWIITEFRVPSGILRAPARALIRVMYAFFRLATGLRVTRLTDHHPILRAAGFRLEQQRTSLAGLLSSELWRPVR